MQGIVYLVQKNTPLTLIAITLSHSSDVISCVGLFTPAIPALFTKISILPNLLLIFEITLFTSSSLVVSMCQNSAAPPAALILATNACPSLSLISVTATLAPCLANSKQDASPMPKEPPVTIATLFSTLFIIVKLLLIFIKIYSFIQTDNSHQNYYF